MEQTLLYIWLIGLMRSAVLCFCNFSRQGQSLFNLLGKDKTVSGRTNYSFFMVQPHSFCSLTMTDKAFLGQCAGFSPAELSVDGNNVHKHGLCEFSKSLDTAV